MSVRYFVARGRVWVAYIHRLGITYTQSRRENSTEGHTQNGTGREGLACWSVGTVVARGLLQILMRH